MVITLEENEEGISLSEVFKILWRNKLLVVISSGMVLIGMLSFIIFWYNPTYISYETKVSYRWPGLENDSYIGMEGFNYSDVLSISILNEIKESNSLFKDVSTSSLVEEGGVSILKENEWYIVQVRKKFFDSDLAAVAFLNEIVRYPYQRALELASNISLSVNMNSYQNSKKLTKKIDYLENQLDSIHTGYTRLIEVFGDVRTQDYSLSHYQGNVKVFRENYLINEIRYLIYQNIYMTKEEYSSAQQEKEALNMELSLLQKRKETLYNSIKNIYSSTNNTAYIDAAITKYLDSLHALDVRIMAVEENLWVINQALEGKYNEQSSELFIENLDLYASQVRQMTQILEQNIEEILHRNISVQYQNSTRIKKVGNISFPMSLILSLFVALIVGMTIGIVRGYLKLGTKKTVKNTND